MNLSITSLFNKISAKDRSFFMRQFAIMISSGIAISNALTLLSQQSSSEPLKQALRVMTKDVENGHPFSVAASRYPNIFDPVSISMIKTGEASGQMHVVISEMANHVEGNLNFTNKVRNALLYPAFVVFVMIVVGIIMTTVIVPRLTAIFADSGLKLPWTTRLLMGISNALIHYWYVIIVVVAGITFGVRAYLATDEGKEMLYLTQTRIPVVKNLISYSYLARFTGVMSMLIKAGVPFTDALRIVAESMPSHVWNTAIQNVRQEVERGIPLSAALSRYPNIVPLTLTQMIAVGEQTGKLDSVMENMADFYEEQTDTSIKGITTLIEPVILMIVALAVAFVVLAVIVPIYGIAEQF